MSIEKTAIEETISQLANQCVLCGLCIPHCPTYGIFRTENESPRGRIFLYKALVEQQINPDEKILVSLDHCLGCFACEKVCPSQVDYSQINRLGRAFINSQYDFNKSSLKQKIIEKVLITPTVHPLLKLAAKTVAKIQPPLQKNKKQKNKKKPSFFAYFSNEIAAASTKAPALAKEGRTKGQVILFKGCSSDLFEQQILQDTILLLNACHFEVIIPAKQYCCGAISIRQGDAQTVHTMTQKNITSFVPLLKDCQAIISINNTCSAHLKDYKNRLTGSEAEEFSQKTVDALSFLAYAIKAANIQFSPISYTMMDTTDTDTPIGVHIPCSLKNSLKEEALLFECLEHIPEIKLNKLNDDFCCGAAGSYMLKYPAIANQLLDKKIDEIRKTHYNIILSSNIGCSLHFKQGLKKQNISTADDIEVMHPIRLLARQLIT